MMSPHRILLLLVLLSGGDGASFPDAKRQHLESIPDIVTRDKREIDHTGFMVYTIPFIGDVSLKYNDQNNISQGGELFLDISEIGKVHMKFENLAPEISDALFIVEINFHFEHKYKYLPMIGSFKMIREKNNGVWHTNIQTDFQPDYRNHYEISPPIGNMNLDIELDRETTFKAHYINEVMNSDLKFNIAYEPGKSIDIILNNKGTITILSRINGTITKNNTETTINIDADLCGRLDCKYNSVVAIIKELNQPTEINLTIKHFLRHRIIIEMKYKGTINKWKFKSKLFNELRLIGIYENDHGTLELSLAQRSVIITANWKKGESIKIHAERDGNHLWTISSLWTDKSINNAYIYEANLDVNFSEYAKQSPRGWALFKNSLVYDLVEHTIHEPFLNTNNTLKIYIDKHNRNTFLPKFKIEYQIVGPDEVTLEFIVDTTVSSYYFLMKNSVDTNALTVNYEEGKQIVIDSKIGEGFLFRINQEPNDQGGRSIAIITTIRGVQMIKYHGETSQVNNATMLIVRFVEDLQLNQESFLYERVVSQYRVLTPFLRKTSELEFMLDKVNRDELFNKFHIKATVNKDDVNVLNMEIATDLNPNSFYIFCPAIFGKIRNGMTNINVTLDYEMWDHLYLNVNHPDAEWKGFKILPASTYDSQEILKIEWDGKMMTKECYELTENKLTIKQILPSDIFKLTDITIEWKNKWNNVNFLLNNNVGLIFNGSVRRLNLTMDWNMLRLPDWDPNTEDRGTFKLDAVGHDQRLGDYDFYGELSWLSNGSNVTFGWTGASVFSAEPLASKSPILTDIDITYDIINDNIEGKLLIKTAEHEYSVTFPAGTFKIPYVMIPP